MSKSPIEIECPMTTCKAKPDEFCKNPDGSRRQLGFHSVRVEFAKRIDEPNADQVKAGLMRHAGTKLRNGLRSPRKR